MGCSVADDDNIPYNDVFFDGDNLAVDWHVEAVNEHYSYDAASTRRLHESVAFNKTLEVSEPSRAGGGVEEDENRVSHNLVKTN